MQRAQILAGVCDLIAQGGVDDAKKLPLTDHPHALASLKGVIDETVGRSFRAGWFH